MVETKTVNLFKRVARLWTPRAELTVSQWADQNRILTTDSSAEAGPWRTDRAPYQREVMDSINDPEVQEVVIMASAQVGKTEFLLNTIGYHMDQDPAPIMHLLPDQKLIDSFSKKRLTPMITASPALRSKVYEAKSRDSSNTISEKSFPGGYITIVGANSPASLSSRPIRIVLCDEVDRYPASAGTEGDPIDLATKRTTTFYNRKHVFVSTPLIKETSRIYQLYNDSTMEAWNLPCPHCAELQPLTFGKLDFEYFTPESGEVIVSRAQYRCEACGILGDEKDWKRGAGKWIAQKEHSRRRGFHLNQLSSPWSSWLEIARSFLVAKREGTEKLQVWINTVLGEPWETSKKVVDVETLLGRRETYPDKIQEDILVLTCGVDVQDNRLEYEVVGWGLGNESWGIEYGVFMGDPGKGEVWDRLDLLLNKPYERADGHVMKIMTTCIDSGGHYTSEVYKFCKVREFNRVWAIKGRGGSGIPYIMRPKRRNDEGAWLFTIGVDVGKDTLSSRLTTEKPGHGYCHFPLDTDRQYDRAYFNGLTAEHKVIRFVKGKPVFYWEKKSTNAPNEPFDLRNYATAALEILNPPLEMLKKQFEEAKNHQTKPPEAKKKAGVVNKGIAI